jgi:hypothetical protein
MPLYDDERAQFDSATGSDIPTDEAPDDPVPPDFGSGPLSSGNWIVWARNDQAYWVSTEINWDVDGEPKRWRLNLPPFFTKWVSSEGWEVEESSQIPRNLRRGSVVCFRDLEFEAFIEAYRSGQAFNFDTIEGQPVTLVPESVPEPVVE